MRTCERGITYDSICGKRAGWIREVNITEWKDGAARTIVGTRPEYLCDEHAAWHRKMDHALKKLHVLQIA